MSQSTLQAAAMEAARRLALKTFRFDSDRETKVADAQSVAWEFSQTAPEGTASVVALFAVRHIRARRQFRESARSIDGPNPRQQVKPERIADFDLGDLTRSGEDPAEIVAIRLDMRTWWSGLTDRQRAIATALALGHTTSEVAEHFGCSWCNVSDFRKRLMRSWEILQS